LLTPFIAQRIHLIDHDPHNLGQLLQIGLTKQGQPIEVNRALRDFAKVVLTGAVGFHYFAGFTGGRKSICPGLASAGTIEATHMLAFDFERGGRRAGVDAGKLDGNAVHEECERVAALIDPAFIINAIVDESLNLAYHGARAEKAGFNIALQRDLDPSVGMADVYPQEITRVLLNLISNGSLPQRSAKRRQIVATTNRHLLPRPRIWVTASKSESATTAPVSRRRRRSPTTRACGSERSESSPSATASPSCRWE